MKSRLSSLLVATLGICGCSSSSNSPMSMGVGAGDAQTPPSTSGTDVEAWLAKADYKKWHCDSAPHPPKAPPSVHGQNRICSNDLASRFTGKPTDERPVASAAVKELWDDAAVNLVGYAVYVKTKATSNQGANWYWYERVPADSMAPHDSRA